LVGESKRNCALDFSWTARRALLVVNDGRGFFQSAASRAQAAHGLLINYATARQPRRQGVEVMKSSLVMVFTIAILLGVTAAASAQDMPPQGPPPGGMGGGGMRQQMPQFADLDKNKDKKISRDEWQGPAQFFDRLDANKDGFIDETEWNAMRQRYGGGGGGPRLGESMAKFLDANKDGKVSRDEFAKMLTLFDLLDTNHDGELTQEEMNGFFRAFSTAQTEAQNQATGGVDVNNLFANSDKNKDGKLTPDEIANDRLFKRLDLNKDGVVTRDEAETALKQLAEERAKLKKPAQQ
jgi:Ca2+-binding EF-hand superfamily protein